MVPNVGSGFGAVRLHLLDHQYFWMTLVSQRLTEGVFFKLRAKQRACRRQLPGRQMLIAQKQHTVAPQRSSQLIGRRLADLSKVQARQVGAKNRCGRCDVKVAE